MTTTVASLITDIRDRLDDYGEGTTALSGAISSTSSTTFTFEDETAIRDGDWLMVDSEVVRVTDIDAGTVRRGQRGSTAATHSDGAVVYVNVIFPDHRILGALNAALDAAYPTLYELVDDDTTLDVVSDQYEYTIPTAIERLYRVEIESETESGVFVPIRTWEFLDRDTIRIYGINNYTSGNDIRCVGTAHFTNLTLSGNLDSDFPDTDDNAVEYLRKKAQSLLITDVQAQIARRDSFKGITDSFQNSQPFMSIAVAKELKKEAEELLKRARMQPPKKYLTDPGVFYMDKGA